MEAIASRKYVRSSPRKMRIVVDLVRGKKVAEALNTLHYLPHRAARPVEITIQSAVHNLLDRFSDERIDEEELVIKSIYVDEAPMFKRLQTAPRGRAYRIRKRNSHLTVVVATPQEVAEEEED